MKKFVLDTSILIYDVDALEKFSKNEVIIPSVVYEEINNLKEENTERGFYARKVAEVLDDLSKRGQLKYGVMLGDTKIRTSYNILNLDIKKALLMERLDYRIIACAKNENAILITRDRMMRVIARDFVEVEEYHADRVQVDELYKGYRKLTVPEKCIDRLYKCTLRNEFDLFPNEFVILTNEENSEHTGVGIYKKNQGLILPLDFNHLESKLRLKLTPLNLEQKMLVYLMLDKDITCVTATGKSGKGKSLLAVDFALASVQANVHNQFMYTKSTISVDPREDLGFYKGDLDEKLKPHLQPLYSSLEFLFKKDLYQGKVRKSVDQKVEELKALDMLRLYPLANIRGMSIFDKVVMLDEAQNTTNHMIKSLVTRINDSSKLIVTGDIEQIDDRNLNKFNNGLTHLVEAGKEEEFIGHICMDLSEDSKRGKLATFGSMKL